MASTDSSNSLPFNSGDYSKFPEDKAMDSMLERIKELESKIQTSKVRFPSLDNLSFDSLVKPTLD